MSTFVKSKRYIWDTYSTSNIRYIQQIEHDIEQPTEDLKKSIDTGLICDFNEDTGILTVSGTGAMFSEAASLISDILCYHYYANYTMNPSRTIFDRHSVVIERQFLSRISSNYEDSYPEDGVEGSKYYIYRNFDIIDPLSLSLYFTFKKNTNEHINLMLSIKPSQEILFGGTISYLVEYQQNNEETWIKVGDQPITSTLIEIPNISTNINNIRVRALASDDMGFKSQTYIYSDTLNLNDIKDKCINSHLNFCLNSLIYLDIFLLIK